MLKKKSRVVLFTVLRVFFLFSPAVSAHDGDGGGCSPATGAEKNKLVADLLKSEVFKEKKQALKSEGY